MKTTIHQGVGLLITNNDQSLFWIQVKDDTYPFEEWRGAYAYWGGAIEEEDKDELSAVEREVEEEIPMAIPLLEGIPKNKIDTFWIENGVNSFWLTLFEVLVPNNVLQQIADVDVLEGQGVLIDRTALLEQKWIWNMDFVFKKYLELKQKS